MFIVHVRETSIGGVRNLSAGNARAAGNTTAVSLRTENREITRFREVIRNLLDAFSRVSVTRRGLALTAVSSSSAIGLSSTGTPATLESSDEINNSTTSFSPEQPAFAGSSTPVPTLSGTYSGVSDDVHTFTVQQPGQLSSGSDKDLVITDQLGAVVETLVIPANYVAGTKLSLSSSGLDISFTDGFLSNNDSFQVTLSTGVDNQVNASNPFNGIGASSPNFNSGTTVTGGSFTINGTSITVLDDDTINSVVAKVTASAAGVTASYDSARERVVLTSTTTGSAGTITLGSDSSGFLSAVRLDTATLVPGTDDDTQRVISDVSALQSIQAGSFSVDATLISEDPATDSLQDVLDRINATVSTVSIDYLSSADSVRLSPVGSTQQVLLDDNGTGFFSALNIATGIRSLQTTNSRTNSDASNIVQLANRFADGLNRLVDASGTSSLRETLRSVIDESVASTSGTQTTAVEQVLSTLGLEFATSDSSFVEINDTTLATAIRQRGSTLFDVLVRGGRTTASQGILRDLDDALAVRQRTLDDAIIAQSFGGVNVTA